MINPTLLPENPLNVFEIHHALDLTKSLNNRDANPNTLKAASLENSPLVE